MRRDRLERIAMAERDRRAGRIDVAVASLGEATEWPARVVLALARLPESAGDETRRILEEGLEIWAAEVGLDSLDEALDQSEFEDFEPGGAMAAGSDSDLDRPIDNHELERAFAEAEAQTDEMHGVNDVAERVLMNESAGLAVLAGDDLVPTAEVASGGDELLSDIFGMDAASVPEPSSPPTSPPIVEVSDRVEMDPLSYSIDEVEGAHPSRGVVLATLSRWLKNIEDGSRRRAQ